MNVYVESNFVLELAFLQEQSESCNEILGLSSAKRVQLVVPAYSLAEPYETLARRQTRRLRKKEELDAELRDISRTAIYAHRFGELTALMIKIVDVEAQRLEEIRTHLEKTAIIIPLNTSVLAESKQYQRACGFSPQDAFVYSSILLHQKKFPSKRSCFLNRNSNNFDGQNIVDQLGSYNCKRLPRFDAGYRFICKALRE